MCNIYSNDVKTGFIIYAISSKNIRYNTPDRSKTELVFLLIANTKFERCFAEQFQLSNLIAPPSNPNFI